MEFIPSIFCVHPKILKFGLDTKKNIELGRIQKLGQKEFCTYINKTFCCKKNRDENKFVH